MTWFIIGLVLLAINAYFGVRDVKNGNSTKSTAFTWFVVGFLAFDLMGDVLKLIS